MKRTRKQIVLQSLILIVFSSLAAFGVNSLRPDGLPLFQSGQGPTVPGIGKIDLATAKSLFDSQEAMFIDSRSEEEFEQGHILGAVNLPYESFDDLFVDTLGAVDLSRKIVVYCSGEDCHSSDILADRILEEGFTNIQVFFAGWPAWVKAGYPASEIKPRPLYTLD